MEMLGFVLQIEPGFRAKRTHLLSKRTHDYVAENAANYPLA